MGARLGCGLGVDPSFAGALTLTKQWAFPMATFITPWLYADALDPTTQLMLIAENVTNSGYVLDRSFIHVDLNTLSLTTVLKVNGDDHMGAVLPFFAKGFFVGVTTSNVTIGKYHIGNSDGAPTTVQPLSIQVGQIHYVADKNALVLTGSPIEKTSLEVMVVDLTSFSVLGNTTTAKAERANEVAWISEHGFITTSDCVVQWQIGKLPPSVVSSASNFPGLQYEDSIGCVNGYCAVGSWGDKYVAILNYS